MAHHISVLLDAGANVDHTVLGDHCEALSAELGLAVDLVVAADADQSIAALRTLTPDTGAVVCSHDLHRQRGVLHAVRELGAPTVIWVDLRSAADPRDDELAEGTIPNIRGRGLDGVTWAARSLVARMAVPVVEKAYGPLPDQRGDLRLPPGSEEPLPVVVLIHGGAWRERWERDLMDGLAVDLTHRGYATWNIEYRRVGVSGGGWPTTFADIASGIDAVAELAQTYPLDARRVALVGHSAGGQLALWAMARPSLQPGMPGADPVLVPAAVCSIAGVLDLAEAGRRGSEEGATVLFMGGSPDEVADRYAVASPLARLPLGRHCRQLIACGTRDRLDLRDGNRQYCARARETSDDIEELVLPGADHFQVIDPRADAWAAIARRLEELFPPHG